MAAAQILAVIIFAVMFLLIVSEKIERHVVSLGCGLLMMVLVFGICMRSPSAIWNTLSLQNFFSLDFWYQAGEAGESSSGINWSTILFIAGMMLMVEGMGRAGFFRCLETLVESSFHQHILRQPGRVENSLGAVVFLFSETDDFLFPVDYKPESHRLYTTRGQLRLYLLPEYGGKFEAYEPVEDAACLLGVHKVHINASRILYGIEYRLLGNLMEHDPLRILLGKPESLVQMP